MTYLPTQKSANPYILPTASPHFRKVQLEMLIDAVKDYAIFMLDAQGYVISWNSGAERIKGYTAAEIIGQHFSRFYPPEDQANHKPEHALATATSVGRYEDINWRVRKDGTRFWAHVILTPILGAEGELVGFATVTRYLTEGHQADIALQQSNGRFRLLVERVHDYALDLLHLDSRPVS